METYFVLLWLFKDANTERISIIRTGAFETRDECEAAARASVPKGLDYDCFAVAPKGLIKHWGLSPSISLDQVLKDLQSR